MAQESPIEESPTFRLIERKPTAPESGAQYIVTGSVTRFGFEERNVGGLFATVATMGMLGYKQHKTEVALTAGNGADGCESGKEDRGAEIGVLTGTMRWAGAVPAPPRPRSFTA